MKNKFLIFIAIGFLFIGYNSFAQELSPDNLTSEAFYVRDPFMSLLPQKEAPEPVVQPRVRAENIPGITREEIIVPPELSVTGIVWGSARPQAIVNDQVVDIGSVIDEALVVGIGKTGVVIFYKGQNFTLEIAQADQKDRATAQITSRTAGYVR